MTYARTIEDVKRANAAAGYHFFSPDTMRFFDSRAHSAVYAGRYFVTSERYDWQSPRLYTVREIDPVTGDILREPGGHTFQEYKSANGAHAAAKRLADREYPHGCPRCDRRFKTASGTAYCAKRHEDDDAAQAAQDAAWRARVAAKRQRSAVECAYCDNPAPADYPVCDDCRAGTAVFPA